MTKVAFINPQSYSNLERYDHGILGLLDTRRFNVTYYCSDLLVEEKAKIRYVRQFNYSNRKRIKKLIHYLSNFFNLCLKLRREQYEVVHIQWLKVPFLEVPGYWLACKLFKKPSKIVFTAHNLYPHDCSDFYKFFYSQLYRFFDLVFAHDRYTADCIKSITGKPFVEIINHGPIGFSGEGNINSQVLEFIEKFDNRLCLVFGGASKYKGSDILESAWRFSNVSAQGYGLLVLGRGYERFFSQSTSDVLVIDDYVSEATLEYAIKHCAFGLLPYREISQSGVLMSFVHYRKPVLLSQVGAFGELVSSFGLTCSIGTIEYECVGSEICKFVKCMTNGSLEYPVEAINRKYSWLEAANITSDWYKRFA